MPTLADIARLEALIARLTPLADKGRGQVIASEDWNLLVDALIEVGRAALAGAPEAGVPDHDHVDEVAIGWLDPQLRQLIGGGGLGDPAVSTEFVRLRRDVADLAARVTAVGEDLDRSRARLEALSTNDLVRERGLDRLDRKLLGSADDRADIADLRRTLRTLEGEVGRAVAVGAQLEVDGAPLDVRDLLARVGAVEKLREGLTTADGDLLTAVALERRLLELRTSLVTQEDLTDAIAGVGGAGGLDVDALTEAARGAGREAALGAVENLGAGLRGELATRLAELDPLVQGAVTRATDGLADAVLTEARAQIDAAQAGTAGALRAELDAGLGEGIAGVVGLVEEQMAGIPRLVSEAAVAEVTAGVERALGDVVGRIDSLGRELEALGGDLGSARAELGGLAERVEAARRQDEAARGRLRAELLERIGSVEDRIGPRIDRAVEERGVVLRTELEAGVDAARRDLEARVDQAARQAAAAEVGILGAGLRGDVRAITRQEIDADIDGLRTRLVGELDELNARVAGIVTTEVARVARGIPAIVSQEFEALRPEITRMIDGRLRPDR